MHDYHIAFVPFVCFELTALGCLLYSIIRHARGVNKSMIAARGLAVLHLLYVILYADRLYLEDMSEFSTKMILNTSAFLYVHSDVRYKSQTAKTFKIVQYLVGFYIASAVAREQVQYLGEYQTLCYLPKLFRIESYDEERACLFYERLSTFLGSLIIALWVFYDACTAQLLTLPLRCLGTILRRVCCACGQKLLDCSDDVTDSSPLHS